MEKFILLFFFFHHCSLMIIKDNFEFCNINEKSAIVPPSDCSQEFGKNKKNNDEYFTFKKKTEFLLLEKEEFEIDGPAFICKKEKIFLTSTEDWLGSEQPVEIRKEHVPLTPLSCFNMIDTKTCENSPMNNISNTQWEFDGTPKPLYKWAHTEISIGYKCSLFKTEVRARTLNDTVFDESCLVKDYSCAQGNSLIVWGNDVIKKCPYESFSKKNFTHIGNNILFDYEDNQVVKITGRLPNACGKYNFYQTSLNFYLKVTINFFIL